MSVGDEPNVEGTQETVQTQESTDPAPPLHEQVKQIVTLVDQPLKEGDEGYVVSQAWLTKAREQAEKGESEEDPLGAVDNTDIVMVVDNASSVLKDEAGRSFVPLKPGLQIKNDFDILPREAWDKIVQWHGAAKGSQTVIRYCHNTSTNDFIENFQYELYPPVFTLFKLPASPPTAADTSNPAPAKILTSRHTKVQDFLAKAKRRAMIESSAHVRVWRFTGAAAEAAPAQPGVLTPANSRSTSPVPNITVPVDLGKNMNVEINTFLSFAEGSQRELLEVKDEGSKSSFVDKSTCGEVGLGQEGILVLEEQTSGAGGGEWVTTVASHRAKSGALIKSDKTGSGMLKPGSTASGRTSPTPSMLTRGRAVKGRSKGTVGLGNMGNTCYMNSALQCVRAVAELTEYFLGDYYKKELNPTNPLGNKGEVAKAYANLLKEIYTRGNSAAYTPRQFRSVIGKYNPQFSGYQQQDSQEFVLFLLDGLQEDLNRITKKPYIEKPDSTDEMVHNHDALVKFAEENWRIYKARNDSVITDLFAGMYKSTLQCPVCQKVSIIFDPFNNLTLQLPIENAWAKKITFFPLHSRPVELLVEVEKSSDISDLRKFVSKKLEVPEDRLIVAEMYNHTFYKIFEDNEGVGEIRDGDHVNVYEIEAKPTNWPGPTKSKKFSIYNSSRNDDDEDYAADSKYGEQMLVPVVMRGNQMAKTGNMRNRRSLFGFPTFILLGREEAKSYDKILRKVLNVLSAATTRNILDDDNFNESEDSDTVVLNTGDADSGSSSEGKVQTSSVQGEDGMIDISMRDTDDAEEQKGPRIAYPPMAPIHKDLHPKLCSAAPLPEDLDELCKIGAFKGNTSGMIPAGVSVPSADTRDVEYLHKRQRDLKYPKTKKQPKKFILKNAVRQGGSPDASSSEDELAASHSLPPPAGAGSPQSRPATPEGSRGASGDESDEGIPQVQEATSALAQGHGELHVARLVDYETDTDSDEIDLATAKKNKVVSNEASPSPLIRLGEGLILDFDEDSYDMLFGHEGGISDDSRGMATWDHMSLLPDPELDTKRSRRSQRKKEGVTLDDCLDEFGKPEILSENDAWYCPQCKEHRRASKNFELWKVPDVLVIHIKRFAVQGRFRDKLDVLVKFPTEGLDLTERMRGKEEDGRELIYDLFAVDNHYGGLGGGHYTAYAQNFVDGNWYYFDDSMTRPVTPEESVTTAAYLLFYRRRNSNVHLGGPSFDKVYDSLTDSSATAAESEPTSRTASPGGYSGEGQRLGGSSRNGSSSAYLAAEAVHQAGGGGPEAAAEEEQEPQQGKQARIVVNDVNSDDDEGYGGSGTILPSYEESQLTGLDIGPVYGQATPWNAGQFSWPDGTAADDADVSSTGAVDEDADRSFSSRAVTPERMDEDAPELEGILPDAQPILHGITPEPVAEIRVHGDGELGLDDDHTMKTD